MISRRALGEWAWSLSALVGCVLTFTALVVVVGVFDQKPPSDWLGISPNTVISILSVALRGWMIFSASECISQWKWILFARAPRKLIDFERIDLASRGPLGSIDVLWRKEIPLILRLGVAVTVLAIILDPFSQQLLRIQSTVSSMDAYNGREAYAARTEFYTFGGVLPQTADMDNTHTRCNAELLPDMEMAMTLGLSRSMSYIKREATLLCPTGNCTWPVFETIGVCHRCNDVTEDLTREKDLEVIPEADDYSQTAWALPNGHLISNLDGTNFVEGKSPNGDLISDANDTYYTPGGFWMTAYGTGLPRKTMNLQDVEALIWSISIIEVDSDKLGNGTSQSAMRWPDTPLKATECGLYYCVKRIESRFENNLMWENITEATDFSMTPESWKPAKGDGKYGSLEDLMPGIPEAYLPDGDLPTDMIYDRYTSCISRNLLSFENPTKESGRTYSVRRETVMAISEYIQSNWYEIDEMMSNETFDAARNISGPYGYLNGYAVFEEGERVDPSDLATTSSLLDTLWRNTSNSGGFEETIATLATSMTNEMRINKHPLEKMSEPLRNNTVTGTIHIQAPTYSASWGWIAFHSVVLVSGVIFCLLTIRLSSLQLDSLDTVPIWKSSSLPVLHRGTLAQNVLGGTFTLKEMEDKSKKQDLLITVVDEKPVLDEEVRETESALPIQRI